MTSVWLSVRCRSVIAAAVAVLATSSCGPRPDQDAGAASAGDTEWVESHSALGDFLAARLAQSRGDSKTAADYFVSALAHDPDNIDLMQRAFALEVAEGKIEQAVPLAERLTSLDTDSPLPGLVLGLADLRNGRYAAAEKRFTALPKHGVNVILSPLLAAWAVAGEGRTDVALERLAVLAQNNNLKPLRAFHAALINDLAGRSAAAEEQYKAALDGGQLNIRAIEALGSLYQRGGQSDRAKDLYDRYHAEHPDTLLFDGALLLKAGATAPKAVADASAGTAEALFDIATLLRQGNVADHALLFSRLAVFMQPDFPLAQMTAADILSAQGRPSEANAVYHAINPGSPVHTFARLRVAMNLDDMGEGPAAEAELRTLAEERPDNVDALVTMGDIQRRHKNFAAAVTSYTAAIARLKGDDPSFWALYYSRGISLERSNQWPAAEADFVKALQIHPDQPDVLNYLGYSWIDQGVNLERGRAMIEKAVQLRPNDGAIVDSLGWALFRMGDFPAAVKVLEHAVELKPEDPTINEHLGDGYWRVGRLDEAREQWKRALQLDPEPEQLEELKAKAASGQLPATKPSGK